MGENLNDIKALVVDDNMANAVVLSTLLERYGIQSDTAESGMEAIERVCSKEYEIIMMDHLMPDMDGLEATSIIKSKFPSLPVIALTANAFSSDREKAFEAGCSDFLSKPVNSDLCLETIAKYI